MHTNATIARALAAAFVASDFDVAGLVERGNRLFGRSYRWLPKLAERVVSKFANERRPRLRTVANFLLSDSGFARACAKYSLFIENLVPPTMISSPPGTSWDVPPIDNAAMLAKWLGIAVGHLYWLADLRRMETKTERTAIQNYHYRLLTKRFGSVRLIEIPKPRLKSLQRQILRGILDRITPHDAAHGFRMGRSITTFITPHVGRRVVLRIDLQDFFPSIRFARVQALFRTIGYPEAVADLLAGLSTNAAPLDIWETPETAAQDQNLQQARWRFHESHLPQGAPTSPAIANLCVYRLDKRLTGFARAAGASYTRYADDLAFSGDREFDRVAYRFHLHACATIMEEGFSVHHRKTRIMRQGVRQHLAGLVVNVRMNVRRNEYDQLKATLYNCVQHGPATQNRESHSGFRAQLLGRIAFVKMVNPQRGEKLRRLFERIEWS